MEHLGPSRPIALSLALPEWLRALVSMHGAGVFGGSLRIAPPGTPEHDAMKARADAERARRAASLDWLALRSTRGARSIVIGESIEPPALLFFDPSPRPQTSALFLACADGRVRDVGDEPDALHRALACGAPTFATPPRWLVEALAKDADALDVPRLYDTRDEDVVRRLRDACAADDEAATDAAFETLAGARTLAQRIGDARAAIAGLDTNTARDLARQIDRMAARSPGAVRLGQHVAQPLDRTLAELEAIGLAPGGAIDERLARTLDGAAPIDASRLASALTRIGVLGDPAIGTGLRAISAMDAFAWLAVIRDGRVGGTPRSGVEPVPLEWLASLATCWPVLALALFEGESFRWSSPHLVTMLSHAPHPSMRALLLAVLEHAPVALANGAAELAAGFCLEKAPATADEARRWIAAARKAPLPKRYVEHDGEGVAPMALLARSVALPEVARFFVTDVTRSPYVALQAAKMAAPHDAREILHALYTGAVPIDVRLSACELAIARGDGRASALSETLKKADAAQARKLSRM